MRREYEGRGRAEEGYKSGLLLIIGDYYKIKRIKAAEDCRLQHYGGIRYLQPNTATITTTTTTN